MGEKDRKTEKRDQPASMRRLSSTPGGELTASVSADERVIQLPSTSITLLVCTSRTPSVYTCAYIRSVPAVLGINASLVDT